MGQARICLEKTRDRHDRIIVQEKLDGSCCSVARVDGVIYALGRAGYLASSSKYVQHQYFADYVRRNYTTFMELLRDGERFVGEWLAQAHGTLYDTAHPGFAPYVIFDLMTEDKRAPFDVLRERIGSAFPMPRLISDGPAFSLEQLREVLEPSGHGASVVEGAVYRVERRGVVDYLAKWVRPDKVDGCYLPEHNDGKIHWHWKPDEEAERAREEVYDRYYDRW